MYCTKCGKENLETNQFCGACGQPMYGRMASVPPHMAPGPAQYVSLTSNKSRTTAALLCLLGLVGFAGFHRIYVGKIISGILYFLTLGFLWLGTIIDLVQLAMGQFTDNVGQPLRK